MESAVAPLDEPVVILAILEGETGSNPSLPVA